MANGLVLWPSLIKTGQNAFFYLSETKLRIQNDPKWNKTIRNRNMYFSMAKRHSVTLDLVYEMVSIMHVTSQWPVSYSYTAIAYSCTAFGLNSVTKLYCIAYTAKFLNIISLGNIRLTLRVWQPQVTRWRLFEQWYDCISLIGGTSESKNWRYITFINK